MECVLSDGESTVTDVNFEENILKELEEFKL